MNLYIWAFHLAVVFLVLLEPSESSTKNKLLQYDNNRGKLALMIKLLTKRLQNFVVPIIVSKRLSLWYGLVLVSRAANCKQKRRTLQLLKGLQVKGFLNITL